MNGKIESSSTPGVTYFRVSASEMLFDTPETCPAFDGLVWHGVAATTSGDHHLIISMQHNRHSARAYLGPDPEIIARRGLIIIAALRTHDALTLAEEASILVWLADCWTTFHTTLLDEQSEKSMSASANQSEGGSGRP